MGFRAQPVTHTPAMWRTDKTPSGGCVSRVVLGAIFRPVPYLDNRQGNSDMENCTLAIDRLGFEVLLLDR